MDLYLCLQESFELKQASMFIALDKLFLLHNAMLLESRLIKAFFVYCISIFVIYMFTSTKQTYKVRPWLYIGMSTTSSFPSPFSFLFFIFVLIWGHIGFVSILVYRALCYILDRSSNSSDHDK